MPTSKVSDKIHWKDVDINGQLACSVASNFTWDIGSSYWALHTFALTNAVAKLGTLA